MLPGSRYRIWTKIDPRNSIRRHHDRRPVGRKASIAADFGSDDPAFGSDLAGGNIPWIERRVTRLAETIPGWVEMTPASAMVCKSPSFPRRTDFRRPAAATGALEGGLAAAVSCEPGPERWANKLEAAGATRRFRRICDVRGPRGGRERTIPGSEIRDRSVGFGVAFRWRKAEFGGLAGRSSDDAFLRPKAEGFGDDRGVDLDLPAASFEDFRADGRRLVRKIRFDVGYRRPVEPVRTADQTAAPCDQSSFRTRSYWRPLADAAAGGPPCFIEFCCKAQGTLLTRK